MIATIMRHVKTHFSQLPSVVFSKRHARPDSSDCLQDLWFLLKDHADDEDVHSMCVCPESFTNGSDLLNPDLGGHPQPNEWWSKWQNLIYRKLHCGSFRTNNRVNRHSQGRSSHPNVLPHVPAPYPPTTNEAPHALASPHVVPHVAPNAVPQARPNATPTVSVNIPAPAIHPRYTCHSALQHPGRLMYHPRKFGNPVPPPLPA